MHPVERAKLLAKNEHDAAAVLHDFEEENNHILKQHAVLKGVVQKSKTKKINFRKKIIWYICDCRKVVAKIGKTILSDREIAELEKTLGCQFQYEYMVENNQYCQTCSDSRNLQARFEPTCSVVKRGTETAVVVRK